MSKKKQVTYSGAPLWKSGALWASAFMLLFALGLVELGLTFESYFWTKTEAMVTRSWITLSGRNDSPSGHLSYRYVVDGVEYTNEKIYPSIIGKSKSFVLRSSANRWKKDYPPGKRIRIYYDEGNPSRAAYHKGFASGDLIYHLFLWAFVLVCFETARRRLRGAYSYLRLFWRRPRRASDPKKSEGNPPRVTGFRVEKNRGTRKQKAGHGSLTMDLDTPLEKIFGLVFRIAAIAWGICLIVWITSGFDETFLSYAIQGTIAMVFFTFLDRSLSCSWEIDGAMERIYFCRSFLKWKKRWPRFAFEEVAAIVVDGRYWKLKHGTQWEYFILLVLKDGMVIPASDYERDDLDGLNATAQGYAKALGVPFLPGRQGYATEVYFDESGKQLHVQQVSLP